MADGFVRIEIGLDGGQILGAMVSAKSADALEKRSTRASRVRSRSTRETGSWLARSVAPLYSASCARRVGFGD